MMCGDRAAAGGVVPAVSALGPAGAGDPPAARRDTRGLGSVDPDQCAPGLVCGSCNRTARRGARLPQTSVPAVTVAGTFLPLARRPAPLAPRPAFAHMLFPP